jgi:hypothetical protein
MATIESEHCPTCDGTTFITRGESRLPCPTCSPRTQQVGPHVTRIRYPRGGASRILSGTLFLAAIVACAIAIWAKWPSLLFR